MDYRALFVRESIAWIVSTPKPDLIVGLKESKKQNPKFVRGSEHLQATLQYEPFGVPKLLPGLGRTSSATLTWVHAVSSVVDSMSLY